jgi:hypothetical protein
MTCSTLTPDRNPRKQEPRENVAYERGHDPAGPARTGGTGHAEPQRRRGPGSVQLCGQRLKDVKQSPQLLGQFSAGLNARAGAKQPCGGVAGCAERLLTRSSASRVGWMPRRRMADPGGSCCQGFSRRGASWATRVPLRAVVIIGTEPCALDDAGEHPVDRQLHPGLSCTTLRYRRVLKGHFRDALRDSARRA